MENKYRNKIVRREGNHLKAKNFSAYWLEEIVIEAKYAGTVYIVDGEYAGTETLPSKLKRILANDEMRADDEESKIV